MKTRKGLSVLAVGAAWLALAPSANAIDSVAKEVLGYNGVTVVLDPRSSDCGIKGADLQKYAARIRQGLTRIGLGKGPDYLGTFVGRVYTQKVGGLRDRCFVRVEINIVAALSLAEIEVKAGSKKKGQAEAFLRSVKTFPIIGYQSDIIYLNATAGVPFSVLSRFDTLIGKFQEERRR